MYETALQAFYRLPAYDRVPHSQTQDEWFDLSRFQRFLDQVGNPEKGLPVIHIAGSKGKGSTAALIGSALQALGKRVGVFISPYLGSPTQSIFVDGEPISKEAFSALMERYAEFTQNLPPKDSVSAFEVLTTIALQHFHDEDVDFAILEAGLGGLRDATNVVESPILSVLCPIEKEHTAILGNSVASIAYEKLGIVREETPVVVAHQDNFVLEFARSVCAQKKAPCTVVTGNYAAEVIGRSFDGYSFRLKTPTRHVSRIDLALLGDHQINNAITAWTALETLIPDFEEQPVLDVWSHLTLPARLERDIRQEREVILDGAHTVRSALSVRRTIDQLYPSESMTFILAFLDDKDIEGFVRNLVRWGDAVVLTQVDHPRAIPARVASERLKQILNPDQITFVITNNVRIAWQKALKLSHRSPICVTGSFQLIEEI